MHARAISVLAAVALYVASTLAAADCTDTKIKTMAQQGKTVAAIAKTCKMDKDDVQAVLDDDEESDADDGGNGGNGGNSGGNGQGLPSGTPLAQCACWGPVNPGYRQQAPQCRSGYAKPSACNFTCPAGGFAWRGVCG